MRLIPFDKQRPPKIKTIIRKTFNERETDWGFSKFCSLKNAIDPAFGYCDDEGYLNLIVEFT